MPENNALDDRLIACEPIHIDPEQTAPEQTGPEQTAPEQTGTEQIGPQPPGPKTTVGAFVNAVSLIPLVRQKLQSHTFATHTWIAASKEPVALIVRDRNGTRIVQFGTALSIEQLRAQIPELDDFIAPYS